jgi:hypothetical protein
VSRSNRFIGGKDASKLALVVMRVQSGRVPTAKQLDALAFEDPAARKAAAQVSRQPSKRASAPRMRRPQRVVASV